jgi:type 1 glutamine amidotransferase
MSTPRTIVFIAGPKSHGPEGNGCHDYPWDARVAAAMLMRSNVGDAVRVRVAVDGWPTAEELAGADGIALFCDGRDGESFTDALHLAGPERIAEVERLMARGCGIAVIHFGTFASEADGERVLRWCGGYFQWQGDDGARRWRSAITTLDARVEPATPDHPALRGVAPFRLREEFYHDLRFPDADPAWAPLLRVPDLPAQRERGTVVAWARDRPDGGRGFGATLGHFHANWRDSAYRTALLNGIAWSAGVEIPAEGVRAPHLGRDQAAAVLRAADAGDDRLRVLLLAGNAAHRWHHWERSTPAIAAALARDPRMRVDVVTEAEELARRPLETYAAIALNYCNWQDPVGLSAAAQEAFSGYVARGGGLLVLHFSNGAFHRSLPGAEASDWPEYRRMVRRVWDHAEAMDGASTHDVYRTFVARPAAGHAITDGLAAFAVEDELYVRQRGDEAIEPLLTARSQVTGEDAPLAWTYRYGRGRVFQTLLGHSERTYDAFGAREMLRRAAAWVAGREVRGIDPADEAGREGGGWRTAHG